MKIYITGKITGDPDYKKKFHYAEKCLKSMGHACMNPAWIEPYQEFTWLDYMQITHEMQKKCDAVLMLADWKDSKGAMKEFEYAKALHQNIYFGLEEIPIAEVQL